MKILLTGSTGLIGGALLEKLLEIDMEVIAPIRALNRMDFVSQGSKSSFKEISDISSTSDWSGLLKQVKTVIHCAGISGSSKLSGDKNLFNLMLETNTNGALNLARQSAASGVKRFIFISTVKVHGEKSKLGYLLKPNDSISPKNVYALSKAKAEAGLKKISHETAMEIVIIRVPMVYGKNTNGNFDKLANLIKMGIPLPLSLINNKRSFVSLNNLVDLVITCIKHPNASNQVIFVGDGEDFSTPNLIRKIAFIIDKPVFLFPLPTLLLRILLFVVGKKDIADSLIGSLQIDISATKDLLDWSPPFRFEEELKQSFLNFDEV